MVGVVGILIVVVGVVWDSGVVVVWLMRLLRGSNNGVLFVGGVGLLVVRNSGVVAVSCGCWAVRLIVTGDSIRGVMVRVVGVGGGGRLDSSGGTARLWKSRAPTAFLSMSI